MIENAARPREIARPADYEAALIPLKAGAEAKTGAEIDKDAAAEIASVWKAIQGVMNHDGR